MGGTEVSPERRVGLSMPGGEWRKIPEDQKTVSKEVCVASLSSIAVKRVEDYCEVLFSDEGVNRDKLDRTKNFFLNSGALGKVVSIYSDLLPDDDQVTLRKQKLLGGHLSFVLERAIDQQLNNPENYVSHGFNHTLNVVKYTDQIITEYPEIISRVHWQYDVTSSQARFILRNVALFHDFGYPGSESRKLNKASHSVIGADVISYGQIELDGQKISVGKVLSELLDDTSNGRIVNDLRDSIMLHNADKIDHFYDVKIMAAGGREFLVDKANISEAFSALKELGYKIYGVSVCADNPEDTQNTRLDVFKDLIDSEGIQNVPLISTETGEKYKGRSLGKKGENSILGLEYSDAAMMKNPLIAVIRIADNMDIVMAERFSDLQLELLLRAYYHELGDENSELHKWNKEIENVYKEVKQSRDVKRFRKMVAAHILAREIYQYESEIFNSGTSKIVSENIAEMKKPHFIDFLMESLNKLDIDECISCWRGFVLDQIALRPEFELVDAVVKAEIKKVAVKMDSSEFKHFAGFEAVREVQMTKYGIAVTVDEDVYDELNKIKIKEEIRSPTGQVSYFECGAGKYQIERLRQAMEIIEFRPGERGIPVYVIRKKYISN